MKFYISARGIKKLTLSEDDGGGGRTESGFGGKMKEKKGSASAGGGGARLLFCRSVMLSVLLIMSLFLSSILIKIAFLAFDSAADCSSSLECLAWRILGGNDEALLRDELTKALADTTNMDTGKTVDGETFNDLVTDMTSTKQDIKTFAFMAKTMMVKMEQRLQSAKRHENMNWHLASHSIPKNIQCLSLLLAEEYATNSMARSRLPSPEFAYRLTDPSFHHIVLITDNVIAASVVISSAVKSSTDCKKMVFHVITDRKTYTVMNAWFAVNNIGSGVVVEVKGLHQYDWSNQVNIEVKEMLEIHRQIWRIHKIVNSKQGKEIEKNLEFLSPSLVSLLNHLRIYMTQLFPDLDKILFLEDDVLIQHDLTPLWNMDLNGKVVGAVVDSWCGHGCCPGRKYKNYFNFANSIISTKLNKDECGWLYGMNVFDLHAWRKTNITRVYHHWLNINKKSNYTLWQPGALPPALLAFEGHVHPINSSWHIAGLGHRSPKSDKTIPESAAVVHFSGPAKPWLEIGAPEVRRLWFKHVNYSNGFIHQCGFTAEK